MQIPIIKSLNEELLHHMSPLGCEHINPLGEYYFKTKKMDLALQLKTADFKESTV